MEAIEKGKSANKIWAESGSTLPFKEWMQREVQKGRFLPNRKPNQKDMELENKPFEDLLNADGEKSNFDKILNNALDSYASKDSNANPKNDAIFGLNKWVLIGSATLIIAAIGYKIYQQNKK